MAGLGCYLPVSKLRTLPQNDHGIARPGLVALDPDGEAGKLETSSGAIRVSHTNVLSNSFSFRKSGAETCLNAFIMRLVGCRITIFKLSPALFYRHVGSAEILVYM